VAVPRDRVHARQQEPGHAEAARAAGRDIRTEAAFEAPSLYDEAIRLLARRRLPISPQTLRRDVAGPYAFDASVEQAWLAVYRAPREHWDLYELAEELVDLEDAFRLWRFRHVTTVERIIGFKPGTGGTSGVIT
jgi:tryptophan 2,3-dioxygenase